MIGCAGKWHMLSPPVATSSPRLKNGFVFPPSGSLPDDLADLPPHNGIPLSHVYFDAAIDRLVTFFDQSPAAPAHCR